MKPSVLAGARRMLAHIIPPARRRATGRDAMPLGVFLAVYIVVCLSLELSGTILFSFPKAFALLAAVPWIWWMDFAGSSGLGGFRRLAALMIRFLVAGVLIALMAEPRAVRRNSDLSVIYALDVSDSIGGEASEAALSYVMRTVAEKPRKDRAGLVVFGRDAAVELPPAATFPFEAVNSRIARDGTNLAKALSLAAAMLPQDSQGRIVLISDGTETEGSLSGVLDELKGGGIAVDALAIQYDYEHEVWLEKLELPRFVKTGETYEAAVILSSLQDGRGTLVLQENAKPVFREEVAFKSGKNRYVLPIYLREPGYYEYTALIKPVLRKGEKDLRENNVAINYLYLEGEGKVLLVADPGGDPRDWQTLERALGAARRLAELRQAYEFPREALSLMPYDCVIFLNVPADAFDAVQLQSLRDAVYNQGAGFLMVGGQNSFGPGGYHRTPVEEVLPVSMDISQRKVIPKAALAIILHTCEFPEGNTWAKRITKEAMKVLGAGDEVGVLAYLWSQPPGGEQWIFPLTPASEYERLVTLVNRAEPGDMPSFTNTMQMGLDGLKASGAATKHMVIISDGDPSPPPPSLVNDYVANKISISMVAVFPHEGLDISIMESIAAATGGRYYCPEDPELLPRIFVKEAKTLKRSMIQNRTFTPRIEFPSAILKGIKSVPELKGYVLTTPKPRSETILEGPDEKEPDPVLTTWRCGLGRTAAFTSDLSPNWGINWVQWGQFEAFVKQLMIDISRAGRTSHLRIQSFADGATGVVVVEDSAPVESFLEVQVAVSGPHERSETVALRQVGPRRHQGEFPLWGKGRYQVVAAGVGDGRDERAVGGFVVPYSPEYLRFRSSPIVLEQIAGKTGGRVLTGNETGGDVFVKERTPRQSSRPVSDLFLVALACLIPLDVGIRRIQLDMRVIRRWLSLRQRKVSTETLGALLKKKQEIRFGPEEGGLAARGLPRKPESAADEKRSAPPGEKPAAPEKAGPPQDDLSTTQRLLARKRKWGQDGK